ncbi:MAG: DNA starvation/stationary phase protection protein [Actinomycetota bacterium]|nr:DNA starvation/stationary phase protection protein [Actinomycetota bacterium]
MATKYTVPGLEPEKARQVTERLQQRLNSLIDLQLTLKHIHWNVVGATFIAVHEMLDPQVDAVRAMTDEVAERIATLGSEPHGTPGYVVAHRNWQDYSLNRATTAEHLAALDISYGGVIADHRRAIEEFGALDLVSQGTLIEQTAQLEQFQWLVRAHLEDATGALAHEGTRGEREAARAAVGGS